MKTNNIIKILVIMVIILFIGLVATTIKLKTRDKSVENQGTPTVVDKNLGDIVRKPEEPTIQTPLEEIKDSNSVDKAPVIENKSTEEDEPSKEKTFKDEKTDSKDKPNKNKPNKEKPDKEKPDKEKPDKDKPNKDKPNKDDKKDNKKDKKDKKDKSKEEQAIVKPKYISKDEAIEIGLNKVGDGAKLIKIKSDLDDNPPKYDLKIILGNYEYEIEVHAITGSVIDFEKEEVDD